MTLFWKKFQKREKNKLREREREQASDRNKQTSAQLFYMQKVFNGNKNNTKKTFEKKNEPLHTHTHAHIQNTMVTAK